MEVSLLKKILALVDFEQRPRHKNNASGTSLELACWTKSKAWVPKHGQDSCACAVSTRLLDGLRMQRSAWESHYLTLPWGFLGWLAMTAGHGGSAEGRVTKRVWLRAGLEIAWENGRLTSFERISPSTHFSVRWNWVTASSRAVKWA